MDIITLGILIEYDGNTLEMDSETTHLGLTMMPGLLASDSFVVADDSMAAVDDSFWIALF